MDRILTVNVGFSGGNTVPAKVNGLPSDGRHGPLYLKKLMFRLYLDITSANVSDAITGRRMMEAISSMLLKPKTGPALIENCTGAGIRWLQRTLTGKAPNDPANIVANSDAAHSVEITFELPFADPRSKEKMDGAQPLAWLADAAFTIQWAAASLFGNGQTIEDSSSLDIDFVYGELIDRTQVGKRVAYSQMGLTTLLGDTIPPGAITDLLLCPLNGGTDQAETDFADVRFDIDGDPIYSSVIPDAVVDAFNESMVTDTAGDCPYLSGAQPEEFPLIWPGQDYDMADVGVAQQRFRFFFEGGTVPPDSDDRQYVVRAFLPQDASDMAGQIAAVSGESQGKILQGLDAASKLAPADQAGVAKIPTNNDVPIHGRKAALWGAYLPRVVNPTALVAIAEAAKGG